MDTFKKKKEKHFFASFFLKKSYEYRVQGKTLISLQKQMIMKANELISSTKISAKINQKRHASGSKINLHY